MQLFPLVLTFVLIPLVFLGFGSILALLAKGTNSHLRTDFFETSIYGIAGASILVNAVYHAGFDVRVGSYIVFAVSTIGLILYLKDNIDKKFIKINITLIWATIWLISIAPYILGGLRVCVFQGNHYDAFNYLEAALTYRDIPHSLVSSDKLDLLTNLNGFPIAVRNYVRPAFSILVGMFSLIKETSFLAIAPAIVNFAIFCTSGIICKILQISLISAKRYEGITFGSVFCLGFWGQYIQDINAWSQAIWTPVLMLVVFNLLKYLPISTEYKYNKPNDTINCIIWTILISALIYLYPEGTIFSLPSLVIVYTMIVLLRKNYSKDFKLTLTVLIITTILCTFVWKECVMQEIHITKVASSSVKDSDAWKFYDAYIATAYQHGSNLLESIGSAIISSIGLYFLVTNNWFSPLLIKCISWLGILIFALIAQNIIRSIFKKNKMRLPRINGQGLGYKNHIT